MSGEKPFDPENVQIIDLKDMEARMTPEELARHQARMEQDTNDEPLREARATIDYKKKQAAGEVRIRELRQRKEERTNKDFFCQKLAGAVEQGDSAMLDLFVGNFLKDQTAFEKPANIAAIQKIFDRVATNTEDMMIIGEPPVSSFRVGTVYKKIPLADGTVKAIGIKVNADFSFGKNKPVVSFTVMDMPLDPSIPLKSVNNDVAQPNQSNTLVQRMAGGIRRLFGSKK